MNVILVQTATIMEKLTLFSASKISFIISLLVAIVSCLTIFKYKKMNLQITLSSISILLIITQVVMLFIEVLSKDYTSVEFFICNCIPVISIVLLILTITAIKRDKKILSSYDRIR